MARPTRLVSQIRALEAEIESWAEAASGRGRRCAALYRELWNVLTGGESFEEVPACSRAARRSAAWIERHLRKTRGDALGKALLEHTEFGTSKASVCRQWRVRPSEWRYLGDLANWVGEKIQRGLRLRDWPTEWYSQVEQYHEEVTVDVGRQALEDMVLGALEAYAVPKGRGSRYTEVYGVCFGSVKTERRTARGAGRYSDVHIHVRRVALQLRAVGAAGYVERDPRSEAVHLEMAEELFPHDDLIGDFHSHPYQSLSVLRRKRGWRFSRDDERDNREWVAELTEAGYRPRVGLILALARARRRSSPRPVPAPNVIRTNFGRCHCYLSAHRINRDGSYSADDISLRCAAITGIGT